jgi:AcrR family transcriptional regulator
MNGMNQEDARIAYQAGDLFHQHGITATGVEALSKAAGISKRTLYERFGEQGWADRSRVRGSRRACVRDLHRVERAGGTPREQLKQLCVELEATIRAPEFRGCPFASGSSELADLAHPAHPVIRRHKERLRRWMLTRARAAGAADPGQLARQLMIVFDGALVQSLLHRSARPAGDARETRGNLDRRSNGVGRQDGERTSKAGLREPRPVVRPAPRIPHRGEVGSTVRVR